LRDLGPAVWMPRYEVYAVARFADVKGTLENAATFISGEGIEMNPKLNEVMRGGIIAADGEKHASMRAIVSAPLAAEAMRALRDTIAEVAERAVDKIVVKKHFDGVSELARHLPLMVISKLVGLPEAGRERMLDWASASFDVLGPLGPRFFAAAPVNQEMLNYVITEAVPGKLDPGSWGDAVYAAAARGEVALEDCPRYLATYIAPSLDTTIFGMTNALWLFAQDPEQWDAVRENPALMGNAISEVLRLESPVHDFTRKSVCDADVGGTELLSGSWVLLCYGAANRDERVWTDSEVFDVRCDNAKKQLAFGHGPHECVGTPLAPLEMHTLFSALAKGGKAL
jgi:cytochrome P450